MYECPNCGGNLRFDIASQQLACGYCNAQFSPDEITKDKDAEESRDYEVTVFTCPQCAGEIYSTDNTAAGFCSFCGASTILNSRLSREKRPDFIIPFKKTKEDCKTEYIKRVKKAVFAPKQLKNPKYIDGFRGIYMPYWVYYFAQRGFLLIKGTKDHRSGDYIITEHFDLSGNLDNYYKGLSFDASSSFADNISERIAPFDVKNMRSFTPSILSGFYADIPDVGEEIYREDAKEDVDEQTTKYLENHKKMRKYSLKFGDNPSDTYHTQCENVDLAMFPVWFMSYRNKDRVAYATVNGQTGKVVADLPVDIFKYMAGSLLLAVPLFILLNLFLTLVPSALLSGITILALVVTILYEREIKAIAKKERYEEDKGAQELFRRKKQAEAEAAAALDGMKPYVTTEKMVSKKKKGKVQWGEKTKSVIRVFCIWFIVIALRATSVFFDLFGNARLIVPAAFLVSVVFGIKSVRTAKGVQAKKGIPATVWMMTALLFATLIALIKPVSDLYYYASNIVCMAAILVTLIDLIKDYNILATRKLPQFEYRGGDDRA
ncbi:MAG: hypothetical protein K2L07_06375 [Lachnospiraceae bacterium]|nr:hypothetical protein [Lachnospiraceae bacterium]